MPEAQDGGTLGSHDVLIDVTGLSLDALVDVEDSVLGSALRRLIADVRRTHDVVAGWQSYVGDPNVASARPEQ
ncbi:hypothetical protein Val02_65290 [Virgisporangium aliadipatigenens]|uniref:FXSXX-COOH protein n=1 Tax=Virgisporangium aliadipatigenens TaxID=741659 RepID=A0A8J3YTU3_9ACTN|nr:FxSxx-COOH cyclophane-containing RiPP peptide [Virgisporangium aliadipatigenens]GIJ49643.1 hypothetical protein Val02_65290 [Virgisporangium aliadipatigenens]